MACLFPMAFYMELLSIKAVLVKMKLYTDKFEIVLFKIYFIQTSSKLTFLTELRLLRKTHFSLERV